MKVVWKLLKGWNWYGSNGNYLRDKDCNCDGGDDEDEHDDEDVGGMMMMLVMVAVRIGVMVVMKMKMIMRMSVVWWWSGWFQWGWGGGGDEDDGNAAAAVNDDDEWWRTGQDRLTLDKEQLKYRRTKKCKELEAVISFAFSLNPINDNILLKPVISLTGLRNYTSKV